MIGIGGGRGGGGGGGNIWTWVMVTVQVVAIRDRKGRRRWRCLEVSCTTAVLKVFVCCVCGGPCGHGMPQRCG